MVRSPRTPASKITANLIRCQVCRYKLCDDSLEQSFEDRINRMLQSIRGEGHDSHDNVMRQEGQYGTELRRDAGRNASDSCGKYVDYLDP